jgi:TonB family protein
MIPAYLFIASGMALAGQIEAPLPEPPVGSWRFTPSLGSCDAVTGIANGAEVRIRYRPARDEVRLSVWDPAWRSIDGGRRYRVTLRFSPATSFSAPDAIGGRVGGPEPKRGIAIHDRGTDLIRHLEASDGNLEVLIGASRLGHYPLPGPRDAAARLRRCAEEALSAGDSAPASMASYFGANDYPRIALRNAQQGTVGFAIAIGTDGSITDCQVTSSSGSISLDEATCRIIRQRARYRPPRDAQGNPTTATDDGTVTWTLPRR